MDLLGNRERLDNQKFEWGEISWLHEPLGSSGRRLSVAQVKIYSGCQQDKHFHLGEEQLFYVVQGVGSFITDGKKEDICKSMLVYSPPYSEHEVFNTGEDDLIFIIVYVPIKLIQLEKPYMMTIHENIQDLIPVEILKNIKDQLSELLKLEIHIYDGNHKLLTKNEEKNVFCEICHSLHRCSKQKYVGDSSSELYDKLYKCDYDFIELEIPITLNENILGYIKSSNFILSSPRDIEGKIKLMIDTLGIESSLVWDAYKKIPNIIKSRVYVIEESLVIAVQFIQEMLERSIFENELTEKDNEILMSTKEKIQLKDALRKANDKMYHDKIFGGGLKVAKEIKYPYELEILLEEAIKELSRDKIEKAIDNYRNLYSGSENIVQEMIIVLSRTALRKLESIDIISHLRKKYDEHLQHIKKEGAWEILKDFCMECIEEYEKVIRSNDNNLIDNINMYINLHYREDLSLNLIANEFYISPNYLSSLFNEKNNLSFSDYIQNLRIEEAKRYLITTKMKVNDISKKVGCKNSSYFANIFRKNVGMTPKEFRKNHLE